MGKAGLADKILLSPCFGQSNRARLGLPVTVPGDLGEPAHAKRQQDASGHATPAPPLVDFLLGGGCLLRGCPQAGRERLVQNVLIQASQGVSLLLPLPDRRLCVRLLRQTRLQGGKVIGCMLAIHQRVDLVFGKWLIGGAVHGVFPMSHLRRRKVLTGATEAGGAALRTGSSSSACRRLRARERRDITVPIGTPVIFATSA